MSASAVHQVIPSLVRWDAIGNHSLQVQSILREMGLDSEIYVNDVGPEYAGKAHFFDRYRSQPGAWLMYQASTGSRLASWFAQRPEPKLVNYHNVTPPQFFERWEPRLADEMVDGRHQIAKLAGVARHGIAVSRYNEEELIEFGYRSTSTSPLMVDMSRFDTPSDPTTAGWLDRQRERGGIGILFHGRISPNKAQHDLVKVLVAYRRLYDPRARLHLTGGASSGTYRFALRRFIAGEGLWDGVDLAGPVSSEELAAYFRGVDVYVSLSEHEGFGAPLLEAMFNGLPIVAFASSAVPETVGDAALLLTDKAPGVVAAAIHRVVTDPVLRASLVEAGRRRLTELDLSRTRSSMRTVLSKVLEGQA
ncbi:MAG TPA: glycosyltransferase family 4 protein [Acidimicrobiales bacterium]|nr:glycosyltransferase family 4 protein [Acidimicrobiales bacterium]